MKESSVFPGSDAMDNDNSSHEYDFRTDFNQFLEEAKKFAKEKKMKQEKHEKKRTKKSWKSVFFSFWRSSSDKKPKKQPKETPKPRGHVSGPIYGVGETAPTTVGGGQRHQHRVAVSGPLAGMFHQQRGNGQENHEVPYARLEKDDNPQYEAKNYGPVYSVS